jgi:hemolysin activation/secretion protein
VANFFQVSGRGDFIGARWTQRLLPIGAYNHTIEVGVEDRSFKNDIRFNNTPLGVDVRSRPFLVRHEGRLGAANYEVRHVLEYVHNLDGGSGNDDVAYRANRFGATSDWNAWRYALEGSYVLGGWVASAKFRGQVSSDALIPGEQFGIGGAAWVRGLEEREGTGDKGYVLTFEAQTPPLYEGIRGVAFFDTGQARINQAAGSGLVEKQSASSVGLGARWVWRRQLSVSIDWAYVLNGTGTTNDNDYRAHASILYRF